MIDFTAPRLRVYAGASGAEQEITALVFAFEVARPQLELGRPLSWTGSLELRPVRGILPGDDFFDPWRNSLWQPGGRIRAEVYRQSTEQYETAWTLRVLTATYDEDREQLQLQLGDLLALLDFDRPPQNTAGIIPGVPSDRGVAGRACLIDAGVPSGQVTAPETSDTINFNVASFGGSLVRLAQQLVQPESVWWYVDASEQVRGVAWAVPSSADLSLTYGRTGGIRTFRRLEGERGPTLVRAVGSKLQLQQYSNPATSCSTTRLTYDQIPGLQYPAGFNTQLLKTYSAVTEEVCTSSTGDGQSSLTTTVETKKARRTAAGYTFIGTLSQTDFAYQTELVTWEKVVTADTYDARRRVSQRVVQTYRAGYRLNWWGGGVISDTNQQQYYLISTVTTGYVYPNDFTSNPTQANVVTSSLTTPYSILNSQGGFTNVSSTVFNPGAPGSAPTGAENETILTPAVYSDGTATTDLAYREREITVLYPSSTQQLANLAQIEWSLAAGRRRGWQLTVPALEELLFASSPLVRVDVAKTYARRAGGTVTRTRQLMASALKFVFEADQALCDLDGLWMGGDL